MTNLKQHKKSIKNRKYNKNDYDNHNVIFAYDINFWKHILKRTDKVVIIIDKKKLDKKIHKQLGGTGIGYEKIYIIAYPSLLDPSKILYKSIIFDENSAGAIDGLKHYIDSTVLDVEEYLASIKKSYDSFKFLPEDARIQEILVGNEITFPIKSRSAINEGEEEISERPSFKPTIASAPMIQELITNNKSDTINISPVRVSNTEKSLSSLTSAQEGKPDSETLKSTDTPSTVTNTPSTVSPTVTNTPSTDSPTFTNAPTSTEDYNSASPEDFIVDSDGKRCQKKNSDPKTRKCTIKNADDVYIHDSKGTVCMKKNIGKDTNLCNIEKTKDGKLCNRKNINIKTGNCDKEYKDECKKYSSDKKTCIDPPIIKCENLDPKTGNCNDKNIIKKDEKKISPNQIIDKKTGNIITKDTNGKVISITDKDGKPILSNKDKKIPTTTQITDKKTGNIITKDANGKVLSITNKEGKPISSNKDRIDEIKKSDEQAKQKASDIIAEKRKQLEILKKQEAAAKKTQEDTARTNRLVNRNIKKTKRRGGKSKLCCSRKKQKH